jgi:hypothetical protein
MTEPELVELVERCLTEGVPPGVVARIFGLDVQLIKDAQKQLRTKRYGTDDLVEYTEQLQWDAVDKAREILNSGSAADQTRFIAGILGKQVAIAARRTPAAQRDSQEKVLSMFESMRNSEPKEAEPRSRFVVRADG